MLRIPTLEMDSATKTRSWVEWWYPIVIEAPETFLALMLENRALQEQMCRKMNEKGCLGADPRFGGRAGHLEIIWELPFGSVVVP